MDTDMTDAGGDFDIILDDEGIDYNAPQPQQPDTTLTIERNDADTDRDAMPAAYYESLDSNAVLPDTVNLQGVRDFNEQDPTNYLLEHYPAAQVQNIRWVNDNSVNLVFATEEEALAALAALTASSVEDRSSIAAQAARLAARYSEKPNSTLHVRQANAGDRKERNAARQSEYYRQNPDARRPQRESRRPRQRYVDIDDSRGDEDASLNYDDPSPERKGHGGRIVRKGSDRWKPESDSNEPRFGRLRGRGRSISPASDGDGRYGFEEGGNTARQRYRDRSPRRRRNSRGSHPTTRHRSPEYKSYADIEAEKISTKRSQGNYTRPIESHPADRMMESFSSGRSSRDPFPHKTDISNHRRTDATDETANTRGKPSLLSRMTIDGKPLAPTPKRSLLDRITYKDDDEEKEEAGFSIRGTASSDVGFSIRGTARSR